MEVNRRKGNRNNAEDPAEDRDDGNEEYHSRKMYQQGYIGIFIHAIVTLTFFALFVYERSENSQYQTKVLDLESSQYNLAEQLKEMRTSVEMASSLPCNKTKAVSLIERRMDLVKFGLQHLNRDLLVQKFGKEPYYINMTILFPDQKTGGVFTIKMAPASLMPHTVHYFMTQVPNK